MYRRPMWHLFLVSACFKSAALISSTNASPVSRPSGPNTMCTPSSLPTTMQPTRTDSNRVPAPQLHSIYTINCLQARQQFCCYVDIQITTLRAQSLEYYTDLHSIKEKNASEKIFCSKQTAFLICL